MLVPSQRDVLLWRDAGWTAVEIANRLYVSATTIRDRIARAEQKIEIHERGEGFARPLLP